MFDWFAYRLEPFALYASLAAPVTALCEQLALLEESGPTRRDPLNLQAQGLAQFHADLSEAKLYAQTIGWNETLSSVRSFMVPFARELRWGFLLTQGTDGTVFVVSPVPLPHLDNFVDEDGVATSVEVNAARDALSGLEKPERKAIPAPRWARSAKGNLWCKIEGVLVTVFPSKRGPGFSAILSGSDEAKPVFTKTFREERACCAWVADNFWNLIAAWEAK
jgi:hypothetical protein